MIGALMSFSFKILKAVKQSSSIFLKNILIEEVAHRLYSL